jgi:hypothetical protein
MSNIGRPKGSPNKMGRQLKEMILNALERAGGEDYLMAQAHENPKTFLLLLGRVLPLQVTGDPEHPIQQVIRWATNELEATQDPSKKLLSHTPQETSGGPSTLQ